eukprot:gb/GECH01009301.1/.p1 GENE.gb/GECH01009301.1/~~gb/GECH01009301.1/.p1  ORF type:complete len:467 (+),score=144.06 gb/GECH01009301.1/:1-1401(+)
MTEKNQSQITLEEARPYADKFIEFVNKSRSPYHAVAEVKKDLEAKGFTEIKERELWEEKVKPCGKYYFIRNRSTVVAFVVGGKWEPGNGLHIIGAHTDSPDLRLRPISAQKSAGYLQVGIQTYGGGLWHTWFDRDLTVAGRVIVEEESGYKQHLVSVDRPILRVPNLAIHLNREVREGFKFNNEKHLMPVLCTEIQNQLNESSDSSHHPVLLDILAKEIGCKTTQIHDFELSLCDTQAPVVGGALEEFIFSPRLDNLLSCHSALEGLFRSIESGKKIEDDSDIRVVAFFDNEEVGSNSAQGAGSTLMKDLVDRLSNLLSQSRDAYHATIAKSFIISADMAHAIHPNYTEKHQDNHRPQIHKGPVIKINANQRYATTAPTSFAIKELARRSNLPIQEIVVRNDMGCGSTIGPIMSAGTGIRTVDLGNPQLSMHSIREMCGTVDLVHAIQLSESFFNHFREIDEKLDD